jgi:hypothetical protein
MRKIYLFCIVCLINLPVFSQPVYPLIDSLVKQVSLDTLVYHVKNLSGENSCKVYGKTVTIKNRVSSKGNDVAADYLKEQFERLGLRVIDQKYSTGGRNIIAEQPGTVYPDQKFIISSHYDAVADYCADDDISSGAAILELARHLTKFKFKYTIAYAQWDEEEIGMVGSKYYATEAKKNGDKIKGVINVEMIGYDSDNDMLFEIHTKELANSVALSNTVKTMISNYKLNLKVKVQNPGTDRSDHASFWNIGVGAITYSEAYFNGDPNPNYHKATDRISAFSLPYFHELSKLSLATIATLAEPVDKNSGILELPVDDISTVSLNAIPNPAATISTIHYFLPVDDDVQLYIYNPVSNVKTELLHQLTSKGEHQHNLNTANYTPGIYFIVLNTKWGAKTQKLIIQK